MRPEVVRSISPPLICLSLLPLLGLSPDAFNINQSQECCSTSIQIAKPMLAISCFPKPSSVGSGTLQRSCIASQLNIVDHVTS